MSVFGDAVCVSLYYTTFLTLRFANDKITTHFSRCHHAFSSETFSQREALLLFSTHLLLVPVRFGEKRRFSFFHPRRALCDGGIPVSCSMLRFVSWVSWALLLLWHEMNTVLTETNYSFSILFLFREKYHITVDICDILLTSFFFALPWSVSGFYPSLCRVVEITAFGALTLGGHKDSRSGALGSEGRWE